MEPTPRPRPTVGVTRRALAIGTGALAVTGALTGWFAADALGDDRSTTTVDQTTVTDDDTGLSDLFGGTEADDDDDDEGFSFDDGGSVPSQPDSSSSVS